MSTLNTFGFNVRRMRNRDTAPSKISQPDKLSPSIDTSSPTPVLAFAATSPESINTLTQPAKSFVTSLSKQSATKSITPPSTKDPKQSTILHFFATPTSSISSTSLTEGFDNTTDTQSQEDHSRLNQQQQQQIQPEPVSQCQQSELCYVRRTIGIVDLLQALEEAFGVSAYGNMNNDGDDPLSSDDQRCKQLQWNLLNTTMPLLQVKPNKVIYPLPSKMMYFSNTKTFKGNSVVKGQRRRRSLENEQVNKRSCSSSFCERKQQQPAYWFMDEFSTQQQGDIEIKKVRNCLSSAEMTSLLLDIANEIMTFEDNNWCNSYLDHQDV